MVRVTKSSMKTKPINKMHYTEFIVHLKSKGIEYIEECGVDVDYWFASYIEVIPIESRIKPKYFNRDGGDQLI